MNAHIYVDETKAKGYLVAAATGLQPDLAVFRKELGALILPGQRGFHMKAESDSRKREIADTIVRIGDTLGIQAVIYDAGRTGTEKQRRARCLGALVEDAAKHERAKVVFDLDESLRSWDRQQMIELLRAAGLRERIAYEHLARNAETLLAIPDAIAWCWARGGGWRTRVRPIISEIRDV
ncbi:hypothetical protein [Arthrobacter sp. MMS18-M83]|uniref:hypothetical protein n=1 Tax=Arthrobacter sp. MMS18-M83 TaxID=2996261 RepID=UPI00227C3619|nr:hypothetical protein [Arthrobacter sp. MMS18-M83]WAH97529.1 hypothetical protein OW521_01095 [Arthrobacter sp. MMS18-M83]